MKKTFYFLFLVCIVFSFSFCADTTAKTAYEGIVLLDAGVWKEGKNEPEKSVLEVFEKETLFEKQVLEGMESFVEKEKKSFPEGIEWKQPHLVSVVPNTLKSGQNSRFVLSGSGWMTDSIVSFGKQELMPQKVTESQLEILIPELVKGTYSVFVSNGTIQSNKMEVKVTNSPPVIDVQSKYILQEEKNWTLPILVKDADRDFLRVFVQGLPAGAFWDEKKKELLFRPTFIQGGQTYTLQIRAFDGEEWTSKSLEIEVQNNIQPPWPTIKKTSTYSDHLRLELEQKTDAFLDSSGYAGRTFVARVVIPTKIPSAEKKEVRVELHGLGGSAYTGGSGSYFRIYPHDPNTTYWYGYSDQLPSGDPNKGVVQDYTLRRILHLVDWMLKNYSQADPERVYVVGSSMGGAGSKFLGLRYARHFCYVSASLGIAIMGIRDATSYRMKNLQKLWGNISTKLKDSEGWSQWDWLDMTKVLRDHPEAKNQFVFARHAKDDATIHFGAAMFPSDVTKLSFYQAIQQLKIGHIVAWDEGGHGPSDPVMGSSWWTPYWNRVTSSKTFLKRNLLFPAFSNSSDNWNPGTGKGNGKVTWSDSSGYAGDDSKAGDTGWDGDIVGSFNRSFRWDSTKIVDQLEKIEIPLYVVKGSGSKAPKTGYPSTGDYVESSLLPMKVDVTLRRIQNFQFQVGEELEWEYGSQQGVVIVPSSGELTIPQLKVDQTVETLKIVRKKKIPFAF